MMSRLFPDALLDWRVDFLLSLFALSVALAGGTLGVYSPVLTAIQGAVAGVLVTLAAVFRTMEHDDSEGDE